MSVDTVPVESRAAIRGGRQQDRNELLRELLHSKTFLVGAGILLFWIVAAVLGPTLVPQSPYAQNLNAINQAPSAAHWFGTDQLGRDMFARVIVGARDVLIIAPLATLIGTVIGTGLGLTMGYFGGFTDTFISRFVEAFLALPVVIIAILGSVALGPGDGSVIAVIGVIFAPLIARTVRSAVLLERQLDYVAAARLRGEGPLYIMFVEILPNVLPPIVVEFTVRLGYAVFTIVTLTFLGFGIQPPSPNWGLDINANFGVVSAGYWWEVFFDALAIAILVVGVNMVANSVEQAFES
jgi:peptide/nickel transport system permease protein